MLGLELEGRVGLEMNKLKQETKCLVIRTKSLDPNILAFLLVLVAVFALERDVIHLVVR